MENELVAELSLSAPLPGREALEPILPKLAEEALKRSLGSRGSGALGEWTLEGDHLTLTLTSEGGRPHQALLAIVRRLSEELGRSRKIGVRSFRAVRYRVRFSAGGTPEKPITLPLPHTLQFDGETAILELPDLPEEALRDNWVDRAIQLVVEKVKRQSYAGKEQYWSLLHPAKRKEHPGRADPTEEMLRRNWVRNGPTKGKWFLGPTAAHLFRTMERIARKEVLEPLGFWEVVQPHHDSFEVLMKTGHLEGLPGEFYYAAEPTTRDPLEWEPFTDLVKITHKVPMEELRKLVGPPSAVLCYAQCPTIYWWLSGRTIAVDSLPLKIYDRSAVSNRYESGGRHGLERVDEFHRIEPVYLGTPEQLVELREALLKRYAHVFDTVLDLEWRTAWVTPFYMQQAGGVGVEDAKERVKGTIDYEAYLPYRGNREHSEWLEFQNLSIVGDKYTKAFTIRAQKGELWSGCSGIGLERWLTTFLSQKGFNPADWPPKFREYCGDLP
ncbi:MAG TPA: serine--tRNA ligase, partial [Thermoplasmata archaeon]|nr:serine--tRNA ligase [Thermoplasmata archaeon]